MRPPESQGRVADRVNRTGSKPGRKLNRPTTRLFCRWRPRRTLKREFGVQEAARIVCKVMGKGHPFTEIRSAVREKCPEFIEEEPKGDAASEALALNVAMNSLFGNQRDWDEVLKWLGAINAAILAALAAMRVVPGAARLATVPAAIVLRTLSTRIRNFEGRIIQRQSQNDAAFELIRRAQVARGS